MTWKVASMVVGLKSAGQSIIFLNSRFGGIITLQLCRFTENGSRKVCITRV